MVDGAAEERKGFLLKCLCLGWKGEGLLVGEEWCPLKAAGSSGQSPCEVAPRIQGGREGMAEDTRGPGQPMHFPSP